MPPVQCAVLYCPSTRSGKIKHGSTITYHRFPKGVKGEQWAVACGRGKFQPDRDATICSLHFERLFFRQLEGEERRLLPVAIPTLHLPTKTIETICLKRRARIPIHEIELEDSYDKEFNELYQKFQDSQFILDADTILKESRRIAETSKNPADKILDIGVRNNAGHAEYPLLNENPHEAQIQECLDVWMTKVKDDNEKPLCYKCFTCYNFWWNLVEFREHLVSHVIVDIRLENQDTQYSLVAYDVTRPSTGVKNNKCPKCNTKIEKQTVLHCSNCVKLYNKKPGRKKGNENSVSCSICHRYFKYQRGFFSHLIVAHDVRSDVPIVVAPSRDCTKCEEKYFVSRFFHHCARQGNASHCRYCFQTFTNSSFYNDHTKYNKGIFTCDICGLKLISKCTIYEHMLKHSKLFTLVQKCILCIAYKVFLGLNAFDCHLIYQHKETVENRKRYYKSIIVPKSVVEVKQSLPYNALPSAISKIPRRLDNDTLKIQEKYEVNKNHGIQNTRDKENEPTTRVIDNKIKTGAKNNEESNKNNAYIIYFDKTNEPADTAKEEEISEFMEVETLDEEFLNEMEDNYSDKNIGGDECDEEAEVGDDCDVDSDTESVEYDDGDMCEYEIEPNGGKVEPTAITETTDTEREMTVDDNISEIENPAPNTEKSGVIQELHDSPITGFQATINKEEIVEPPDTVADKIPEIINSTADNEATEINGGEELTVPMRTKASEIEENELQLDFPESVVPGIEVPETILHETVVPETLVPEPYVTETEVSEIADTDLSEASTPVTDSPVSESLTTVTEFVVSDQQVYDALTKVTETTVTDLEIHEAFNAVSEEMYNEQSINAIIHATETEEEVCHPVTTVTEQVSEQITETVNSIPVTESTYNVFFVSEKNRFKMKTTDTTVDIKVESSDVIEDDAIPDIDIYAPASVSEAELPVDYDSTNEEPEHFADDIIILDFGIYEDVDMVPVETNNKEGVVHTQNEYTVPLVLQDNDEENFTLIQPKIGDMAPERQIQSLPTARETIGLKEIQEDLDLNEPTLEIEEQNEKNPMEMSTRDIEYPLYLYGTNTADMPEVYINKIPIATNEKQQLYRTDPLPTSNNEDDTQIQRLEEDCYHPSQPLAADTVPDSYNAGHPTGTEIEQFNDITQQMDVEEGMEEENIATEPNQEENYESNTGILETEVVETIEIDNMEVPFENVLLYPTETDFGVCNEYLSYATEGPDFNTGSETLEGTTIQNDLIQEEFNTGTEDIAEPLENVSVPLFETDDVGFIEDVNRNSLLEQVIVQNEVVGGEDMDVPLENNPELSLNDSYGRYSENDNRVNAPKQVHAQYEENVPFEEEDAALGNILEPSTATYCNRFDEALCKEIQEANKLQEVIEDNKNEDETVIVGMDVTLASLPKLTVDDDVITGFNDDLSIKMREVNAAEISELAIIHNTQDTVIPNVAAVENTPTNMTEVNSAIYPNNLLHETVKPQEFNKLTVIDQILAQKKFNMELKNMAIAIETEIAETNLDATETVSEAVETTDVVMEEINTNNGIYNNARDATKIKDDSTKACMQCRPKQPIYTCAPCDVTPTTMVEYLNHTINHIYKYSTCPQCSETFHVVMNLKRHVKFHICFWFHFLEQYKNNTKYKKFKCRFRKCMALTAIKDYLKYWKLKVKNKRRSFVENEVIRDMTNRLQRGKKTCIICDIKFTEVNDCKLHLIEHLFDDVNKNFFDEFKCQVCSNGYETVGEYRRHKLKHAGIKVSCPTCAKKFKPEDAQSADSSRGIHIQCTFCGTFFLLERELEPQMLEHVRKNISDNYVPMIHRFIKQYYKPYQVVQETSDSKTDEALETESIEGELIKNNIETENISETVNFAYDIEEVLSLEPRQSNKTDDSASIPELISFDLEFDDPGTLEAVLPEIQEVPKETSEQPNQLDAFQNIMDRIDSHEDHSLLTKSSKRTDFNTNNLFEERFSNGITNEQNACDLPAEQINNETPPKPSLKRNITKDRKPKNKRRKIAKPKVKKSQTRKIITNTKGKQQLRPTCCAYKCGFTKYCNTFSERDRRIIHHQYNSLSEDEQERFILELVDREGPIYNADGIIEGERKKYHFNDSTGKRLRVCYPFFTRTLDIDGDYINAICS